MTEKYDDTEVLVRPAKKEDMKAVSDMIQELADYEKMPEGPKISVKELEHDGFVREPPAFRCLVAELQSPAPAHVVGYALYFPTYSTWEGRALMLEDLYVRANERRRGVGAKLFRAVAEEATATGCSRVDFHVLEWNPACAFYEAAGCVDLSRAERWRCYRLAGPALRQLATAAQ